MAGSQEAVCPERIVAIQEFTIYLPNGHDEWVLPAIYTGRDSPVQEHRLWADFGVEHSLD